MTGPEDWRGLVPELEAWAIVRVLGPGRLELTASGTGEQTTRELLLTPREWENIEGVIYAGDVPAAAMVVRAAWDRAGPEDLYLVYDGQYDVQPQTDEIPAAVAARAELTELVERLRREQPDAEFGWFAHPPDGESD